MNKTPIIFTESVPAVHGLGSGIISDNWLYRRYDFIDEDNEMSEGERRAWIINGKATSDLDYIDKQGNIYEEGKSYFNGVHVWKRVDGQPTVQYVSVLPVGTRTTSTTWVQEEWEIV